MGKKVVAKILVVLMLAMTIVTNVPGNTAKAALNAYYFGNLTYVSQWGVSSRSVTDGALKVTFNSKYGEVKYSLPNAISLSSIQSITIGAGTGGQDTAFKFYDASGKELFVKYNANNWGYDDFEVTKSGSGSIKTIGVMSQSSSTYTATIYNVRITTTSGSSGGTTTTAGTLKGAMSGTFGKVGNAVNLSDLRNANTLNIIKNDFNSITMENEMKPDAVLGYSPTLISTSEAKSRGYIIPDGYAESTVPELNFSNIDEVLKIASQNGLSVRFHTMVWHQQTPSWFFKYDYNSYYNYCNAGTMDKRLEYYVKNIVAHISSSQYKDVVYAYDVVNEYFHNSDSGSKSNWTQVYGEEGKYPSYVKKAFQYANDMLNYYNLRSKVKLFYNDYNTYLISDDIVTMIKFVNQNGKICDGVGMQSHLDVHWPDANHIGNTIDKFKNAGFEIQITELDATINAMQSGYTLQDQANYYYSIIKMLKQKKQGGANITGVTFWGLSDQVSWRASGQPLLFSQLGVKKAAYDAVINAMK